MAKNHKKNPKGYKVTPLKTHDIRRTADGVREYLQIHKPYIDIIGIYDFVLPEMGVVVDICLEDELGDKHGETLPNESIIKIREDVYEGAYNNNGRDRFTLSHELGHLILHSGVSLARQPTKPNHQIYEDSEWQADTFAAELLMPTKHIKSSHTIFDIVNIFGVSTDAAMVRLNKLSQQGVIK